MIPRNILLISFKTMIFVLGGIVVSLFMIGCGGGGGGGTDKGSLMVTLKTDTGVEIPAGAQWRRIVDNTWLNSGDTQSDLKVGSHTVEFKEVPLWIKPNNLTVNIVKDQTEKTVGTYIIITPDPTPVIVVTGKVDDETSNSTNGWDCVFKDMNGALHYSTKAKDEGIYEFPNVLSNMEGYIRCNHPRTPKLQLCTFLNIEFFDVEGLGDENNKIPIPGQDVTPTTTVVADIIDSKKPDDPMEERQDLFDAIENGDTELNALVRAKRILFKHMLRKEINASIRGDAGAGSGGEAAGEAGDGADFSPIANASCDFALDLEGGVLYYDPLEDLRDGKLDRPDLAAIKDEVEEELKDILPQIKGAIKNKFPEGVGDPISGVADEDGKYALSIPLNIQGFVRCAPPDQLNLKLATLVPKLQEEDERLSGQDVTPQTTVFSHSIAKKLSGDLSDVKENYLDEIAGLRVGYTKENGDITEFQVIDPDTYRAGEEADEGVGLVAYSATSLFNIFYQNETDVDYLTALADFIAKRKVDPVFLVEKLGLSAAQAENAEKIVKESVIKAEDVLDTDLDSALSTARIRVRVVDRGAGVSNADVIIPDIPDGVVCTKCEGVTDKDGVITLILTKVPDDRAIHVEVEVSSVSGYEAIRKPTQVVAFATVDLEIAFSHALTVQGEGTGSGTVTSVPSGINCDINAGVADDFNSEYFDADSEVILTAEASQDSTFDGWSGGDCSGTGTCAVTMNQAHTVTATFTRQEQLSPPALVSPENNAEMDNNCADQSDSIDWSFSWSPVDGATKYQINVISSTGGTYINETVTTTTFDYSHETHAEPDSSRQGWSWKVRAGNDNDIWSEWSEQRSFDIEPLNKDCQLTLTVQGGGNGSGVVTSSPGDINCTINGTSESGGCSDSFNLGTPVVLTAGKTGGSTFDGWSGGGCDTTNPCMVTMNQAHTVTATFTQPVIIPRPTLLLPENNAEMDNNCADRSDSIDWSFSWGSVAGATKYQINVISSTGSTYIDEMVTATTFNYSHETHAQPDSGRQGWSWKVRAGNNSGIWSGWSERTFDMEPLNTDCQLTLTVQGGGNGTGVVTSSPGDINCTINGTSESGVCSEAFSLGTPATLTADPTGGSTFDGWDGGGCSGTGTCTVTMNQAYTVIATFTRPVIILPPTLLSPNNNAEMDNNCEDRSDSIDWSFSWGSVAGATKYQINVISSTGSTYIDEMVTATTFNYSHDTHAQPDSGRQGWSWKVRAGNDSGIWSGWSERTFDMEPLNTDCQLDPPTLVSPENNAEMDNNCEDRSDSTDWAFSWSSVAGATKYQIYVIGSGASIPVIDSIVTSPSYNYTSSTSYITSTLGWIWRVRAGNDSGQWSDWSERSFDIEPLNTDCPCTYSISPETNKFPAGGGDGSITVSPSYPGCETPWAASTNATWIEIISGRTGSGSGTVSYLVTINDSKSIRTAAIMVAGKTHEVNQVPFLVPPTLISPDNNAKFDIGSTITFKWGKVPGATKYFIAIRFWGPSPDPFAERRDAEVINSTSYTLSLKDIPLGKWSWAVYALNEYENELIPQLKSEIRDFFVHSGEILH